MRRGSDAGDGVSDVIGVVVDEAVIPVVQGHGELGPARNGLEGPVVGPDAKVAADHLDRRDSGRRVPGSDLAIAIGAVDPVVEAITQAVEPVLGIALAEPGQDDGADVGAAVSVGISEVEDVGRGRDQDASPPGHHAGREREAVGEDRAPLEMAVTVPILQELHASGWAGGPGG